jgi:hypothetical protein
MFELLVFVVGLVFGVVYHAYLNPYVQLLLSKARDLFGKKEG